MPQNNVILDFLKTRRSELALTMEGNAPSEDEIRKILTLSARVPDHGKLAPWRFVVYGYESRQEIVKNLTDFLEKMPDEVLRAKYSSFLQRFAGVPLVIGIISTAKPHEKIPLWEQELSGGAVAQNCLIATQAMGFGAQWLTGWMIYEAAALKQLGVEEHEKVIGLIHIGRSSAAKQDRDRPDLDKIVTVRE